MARGDDPEEILLILAGFDTVAQAIAALEDQRRAGCALVDAHAPFPIPELVEALPGKPAPLPPLAFAAGVLVAAATLLLQLYSATWGYPYVVGGKPLASWPAFVPVAFEIGILAAIGLALVGMFRACDLPRLHHRLFESEAFTLSAKGGVLLVFEAPHAEVEQRLRDAGACHIEVVRP